MSAAQSAPCGGTGGADAGGPAGRAAAESAVAEPTAAESAVAEPTNAEAAGGEAANAETAADEAAPAGAAAGTGPAAGAVAQPISQVRRLRLRGAGGTVARARDFTRRALCDWGWLPATGRDRAAAAEDALLVVSELVTNACLHAAGPDELRIGCGPKLLRVEVLDAAPGTPAPRAGRAPGRPGGHGIFIVQRLCLDWGVIRQPDGAGKIVWAELAAPPPAP